MRTGGGGARVEFDRVTVRVGSFAVEGVSFVIEAGEHVVLMGRTGAGKTTLVEALCGLRRVEAGRIRLGGQDVTGWAPGVRGVGFVPQDGALFDHLTVWQHLAFALQVRGWEPECVRARVDVVAGWLGLAELLGRRPDGLSGGEAQRVALGRALAFGPPVLCLDEPLSALDGETRGEMREVLRRVRGETGATIVHVTHSGEDARALADRVLAVGRGRVEGRLLPTV
jgi:ABC-type sugar transport system ATPase subunit